MLHHNYLQPFEMPVSVDRYRERFLLDSKKDFSANLHLPHLARVEKPRLCSLILPELNRQGKEAHPLHLNMTGYAKQDESIQSTVAGGTCSAHPLYPCATVHITQVHLVHHASVWRIQSSNLFQLFTHLDSKTAFSFL